MVESTEPEDKATLDVFVVCIADEVRADPGGLRDAPHVTPVRRLDEVKAARDLIVTEV